MRINVNQCDSCSERPLLVTLGTSSDDGAKDEGIRTPLMSSRPVDTVEKLQQLQLATRSEKLLQCNRTTEHT